jgi:Arc/MetJ-type ribon-helix-helix transcriptional regulator
MVASAKIAVSLDRSTVEQLDRLVEQGVYPSRSRAIQEALDERLSRLARDRLARECAKLDPEHEAALADEAMAEEAEQWPEY